MTKENKLSKDGGIMKITVKFETHCPDEDTLKDKLDNLSVILETWFHAENIETKYNWDDELIELLPRGKK